MTEKTLRDEFAMAALQLVAAAGMVGMPADWAGQAYDIADAMMKERLKGQAEKPAEDGWKPWSGVGSPASPLQKVMVRLRDGSEWAHFAGTYEWGHQDSPTDIVAYRVVTP